MGERAQERKGEEAMIQMTPLMKDLLDKALADEHTVPGRHRFVNDPNATSASISCCSSEAALSRY
jgi:hypothetical protein